MLSAKDLKGGNILWEIIDQHIKLHQSHNDMTCLLHFFLEGKHTVNLHSLKFARQTLTHFLTAAQVQCQTSTFVDHKFYPYFMSLSLKAFCDFPEMLACPVSSSKGEWKWCNEKGFCWNTVCTLVTCQTLGVSCHCGGEFRGCLWRSKVKGSRRAPANTSHYNMAKHLLNH